MNEKLLLEYIDRMGIVSLRDIPGQLGASAQMWRASTAQLIQEREVFYCRLVQKQETLLSRHLYFCLRAVYNEPELSSGAQDVYDWLSDNELKPLEHIRQGTGLGDDVFTGAMIELQRKLCVTPLITKQDKDAQGFVDGDELACSYAFLWVTDEHWLRILHKPQRYKDLSYCVSEVKRLMGSMLPTREINNMIYKGVIEF